jgi:hypothetical protein
VRRAVGAFVAAFAVVGSAHAEPRWYLQVDNDFFFDTDRWYSSGVRIARVASQGGTATEAALVQEIWTPEGKRFAPGVVDRAPSARLQGRYAWHRDDGSVLQTIELGLGVRGRGARGESVTSAVHQVFSAAKVDWSREVPSEVDASAAVTRSHRLGPVALHYGAVLGNEIAYAHAGAELRMGHGAAVYSSVLRHVATPPFALDDGAAQGVSGFAGVSLRWVVRNALLELPYEAGGEAPRRRDGVARAALGVTATQPWGSVVFALVQESREFAQQRVPQPWGSIVLHVAF